MAYTLDHTNKHTVLRGCCISVTYIDIFHKITYIAYNIYSLYTLRDN